jgi:hypothetical protein
MDNIIREGISLYVLRIISEKDNYTLDRYCKLTGVRNLKRYRYIFFYVIKCKFKDDFNKKPAFIRDVYRVLARELGITEVLTKSYIETFNDYSFPDMPEDILQKLLKLFALKREECFINGIKFGEIII